MTPRIRILVVDDAREHAEMVVEFLRLSEAWGGAQMDIATTYEQALDEMQPTAYDVAFFDYMLGARDGLSLLRDVRGKGVDTPVVVLTSRGAEDVAVEAMKAGAADYLSKVHLSTEALERTIHHALALRQQQRQRQQAEAALRSSEERFRALVENSSDTLLLLDAEGRVAYITPSSQRHLGWKSEDLIGHSVFDFMHPDDHGMVATKFAEALQRPGEPITQQVRLKHSDGNWRVMDGVSVNRLHEPSVGAIVVNARDITDRRKLEDQLWHAQKMEAVGQLAGGVAHDFNNLLTAILGYANLMLDELPPQDPLRNDLEEIRSAGDRAASLTRQLLAFSRRQMLQPQVVDINALVTGMQKLLRRLVTEHVEVVAALAPDLMSVRVDPSSIEQVLVNLAVNARDAMPQGGRLTIETANVDLDAAYAKMHVPLEPARYVMIAVGDTGHGMDEATRTRIFEPFFTTKEQGKGIGLGLATVYGIVKQNGGYIWVYSEVGHGSVFKVYLPPADSAPAAHGVTRDDAAGRKKLGWETVLLVEDEDAVRVLAREVLRRNGYVVLEARHGIDALRIAERHPDDIHLIITDLVMPHMAGSELAKRLSAARPGMKVLYMSGYTDHEVMDRDLTPGAAFMQKPFTPEVLANKVRHVLDMQPTSSADRRA